MIKDNSLDFMKEILVSCNLSITEIKKMFYPNFMNISNIPFNLSAEYDSIETINSFIQLLYKMKNYGINVMNNIITQISYSMADNPYVTSVVSTMIQQGVIPMCYADLFIANVKSQYLSSTGQCYLYEYVLPLYYSINEMLFQGILDYRQLLAHTIATFEEDLQNVPYGKDIGIYLNFLTFSSRCTQAKINEYITHLLVICGNVNLFYEILESKCCESSIDYTILLNRVRTVKEFLYS